MSLTPPSVSRTTPPAERSQQRAGRAPAGDFAALLDAAPAPARAPLARAAERRDDRAPAGGHDERPEPASSRSRHARPGSSPSAAPGQKAFAAEHSHGRDARVDDSHASAPVDVPVGSSAPVPVGTDSTPVVAAASFVAPAFLDVVTVAPASPGAELPAASVAADPLAAMAAAVPVVVTQPALEPTPPALCFAPAGLPLGPAATSVSPSAAAGPAGAAVANPEGAAVTNPGGAAVANPALSGVPTTSAPVSPETVAAAVVTATAAAEAATTTAAETAPPVSEAGPAVAFDATNEASDPGSAPSTAGEPAVTALPTGTGAGSGAGAGSARDGATAPSAAPEEISEAPTGVPASAPAPAAAQGIGRGPDAMPFGQHSSVPLERAPRAVAQLLHVASQRGVSHARIALRPVELGGIEIFLQVSPAGLAAQVIADSPEAARMLAQATEDLRRSLEGQNVELVSIEVSTSAERQQRDDLASSGFLADDWRAPDGRPAPRRGDGKPATAPETPELTTPTVLELPDGLLVDVLA